MGKDDKVVALDDIRDALVAFTLSKGQQKVHEAAAEHWKETADQILELITSTMKASNANVGTVDGKPFCRYSSFSSKRFSQSKFKADHPDLYEKYVQSGPGSRFTLLEGAKDAAGSTSTD